MAVLYDKKNKHYVYVEDEEAEKLLRAYDWLEVVRWDLKSDKTNNQKYQCSLR